MVLAWTEIPGTWGGGGGGGFYLTLRCHRQNDSALRWAAMIAIIKLINCERQIESQDCVNMVLNVHRNHKVYSRRGEGGEGGMEVGEEGDYNIPIATLSPPE